MVTIPEFAQQLQSRQLQLEQAQQEAEKAQLRLSQQQLRQLPVVQRQQIMTKFQQAKTGTLEEIQKAMLQQQQIQKEFIPQQQAYQQYLKDKAEAEAKQQALEWYKYKVPSFFVSGPAYKYLRELEKMQNIAREQFVKDVTQFKEDYPEEKLIVDLKDLQVKGVESEAFLQSMDVKAYQEALEKLRAPEVPTYEITAPKEFDFKEYAKTAQFAKLPEVQKESILKKIAGVVSKPLFSTPLAQPGREELELAGEAAFSLYKAPIVEPKAKIFPSVLPQQFTLSTVGKVAEKGVQRAEELGILFGKGIEEVSKATGISTTKEIPATTVGVPLRETIMGLPGEAIYPTQIEVPGYTRVTGLGLVKAGAEAAPFIAGYALAPEVTAGVEVLAAQERRANIDELISQEKEKQFTLYKEGGGELSKSEYLKQETLSGVPVGKEIEDAVKKQSLLEIAAPLAFLGGSLAFRGVKATTTRFISTEKLAELELPAISAGMGIEGAGGKLKEFSKVGIFQPKMEVYKWEVTTPFREFFGLGPVKSKGVVGEGLVYNIPEPRISYLFGPGEGAYYEVSAKVSLTSPEFKTGIPQVKKLISEPSPPITLEGDKFFSITDTTALNLRKLTQGENLFKEYLSGTFGKEIPTGTPFKKFQFVTYTRDVTKPVGFLKTTEKPLIPTLEEFILIPSMEEPSVTKYFISKGVKGKPTISLLEPSQIQTPQFSNLVYTPKPFKLKKAETKQIGKATGIELTKTEEKQFPYMVGGTGLKYLPYAGTGEYELAEGYGLVPPGSAIETSTILKQAPEIKVKQFESLVARGEQLLKPITLETLKPITTPSLAPKFIEKQVAVPKLKLTSFQIPKLKQVSVLKVIPKVEVTPKTTPKPRRPGTTKLGIPKVPMLKVKPVRSKFEAGGFFIPEIRRAGVWKPIGKYKKLKKAKEVGLKTVRTTLAASLRIKKGKKFIDIKPEGVEFRPSRKEPFVIVEKKERRLKTPTEISEIFRIRRRSKVI